MKRILSLIFTLPLLAGCSAISQSRMLKCVEDNTDLKAENVEWSRERATEKCDKIHGQAVGRGRAVGGALDFIFQIFLPPY